MSYLEVCVYKAPNQNIMTSDKMNYTVRWFVWYSWETSIDLDKGDLLVIGGVLEAKLQANVFSKILTSK